ncbi:phosphatidate cytidylyltransferase [Pancytospora philotis]|nr:phosphatidate cytidylyltransferase [Pancytospora philotis]
MAKGVPVPEREKPALRWPRQRLLQLLQTNVFKRSVLGLLMLYLFVVLCSNKKIYIISFVIALTAGICYELLNIVRKRNRPFVLNRALIAYLMFIIYTMKLLPSLVAVYPSLAGVYVIGHHRVLQFYGYAAGLMLFVVSLRKSQLSSQMLLYTVIHLSAYILGSCCALAVLNIERGRFYFFYPCILVISNDIFAYVIGKLAGRTPLYAMSPNKTVEGFLGASVFTFLTGVFLCYIKLYHGFLPDQTDSSIAAPIRADIWFLNIPMMFLHNVAFAFYASFVAPFIGFLASAIKRVFRKKDFGAVIPGHGGLTDRMDCQLLMVYFTYFYLNSFFQTTKESLEYLGEHIRSTYQASDIAYLISKLSL